MVILIMSQNVTIEPCGKLHPEVAQENIDLYFNVQASVLYNNSNNNKTDETLDQV